jgi:hypothetical protein
MLHLSPPAVREEVSVVSATTPLFPLGRVVATAQAHHTLEKNGIALEQLVGRHQRGDWGNLASYESRWNREALDTGGKLMSVYRLDDQSIIWVVTAADHSMTRVCVPIDGE